MLLSDATLRGFAGGPSATGGTLSVSSGRFYVEGAPRTSADINLIVTQSGNVIPAGNATRGVGIAVLGADGAAVAEWVIFQLIDLPRADSTLSISVTSSSRTRLRCPLAVM